MSYQHEMYLDSSGLCRTSGSKGLCHFSRASSGTEMKACSTDKYAQANV